jgi:small-conductance mechanosensitive channel
LNEEDDIIFIPNTTVLSHDIINFSKGESRKASMEFTISAQTMNNMDALEQQLSQALSADDNIERDTFKLKILHVKFNKARVRAEVNLKIRDRKAERRFKRLLLDAWFGYISK